MPKTWCFKKGIGTKEDKKKEFELYNKESAEKGNIYGKAKVVHFHYLNICKADSELYEKYKKDIFEHYQECADNSDTYGMINLGIYYEREIGTDNSLDNAFKYYLESAKKGNAIGMKEVAHCYQDKIGIPKAESDKASDKASKWSNKYDTVIQDLERYYIVKLKKRFNEWKNLKTLTNTYFIMHILFCLLVLIISIALIIVEIYHNMQPKAQNITKIVFSGMIGSLSGLASLFQLKALFSRFKSGFMNELYNKEKELNTNRYEVNWIFRIQEANQFIKFKKK